MNNELLLFDTDIGTDVDDAFALALLAKLAEKKILGVVTTNGPTLARAQDAATLLRSLGLENISVFQGISRPKTRSARIFLSGRESDNIDTSLPVHSKHVLIEKIRRISNHSLTVIVTGPHTTLSWLLQQHGVASKIKKVFIMGGSLAEEGIPQFEHNFTADPASTHEVLSCRLPIFLIPLNITLRHALPFARLNQKNPSLARHLLIRWSHNWLQTTKLLKGEDAVFGGKLFLHDPITVMAALHPESFSWDNASITIDNSGHLHETNGQKNVKICTQIPNRVIDTITQNLLSI